MTKYNIVTGWRRGGTSAMMGALRQCGIPVVGHKFGIKLTYGGNLVQSDVGAFFLSNPNDRDNPTGYWEIPTVVLGLGITEDLNGAGMDGELMKVPFEMIPKSIPKMIDKVVIILRDPLKVITSRLGTAMVNPKAKNVKQITALGLVINGLLAFNWFKKYKKPYHIVLYEDLVEHPLRELKKICDFLGRGDPRWGAKAIQKKLNKSKPIKSKDRNIQQAVRFYNDIKKGERDFNNYNTSALRSLLFELDEDNIVRIIK